MSADHQLLYRRARMIKKDVAKEKVWQEMDDLEQELCKESSQEGDKKADKKTQKKYKKPDPSRKIEQIRAYEDALKLHRRNCSQFRSPWGSQIQLNIPSERMIKLMEQAKDQESNVPLALRSIGLKKVKILFKCGAVEHFQSVIEYLKSRRIPGWMKMKHEELLRREF